MAKERIYLTDLTLHAREYRPTVNFAKVAQKGRMYSPLPSGTAKTVDTEAKTAKFVLPFPPDLQERIDRGEVEIMVPNDGLYVYAGKDAAEMAEAMAKKERRENVHKKWGKKNWLDGQKDV